MLQKTYITLLFLLVASSAFAQKTERDYLRSGNKLYNDSLFIKAEVDYRKALEINPKSTDAMFNLGNSLLMQQKAKEAMEQFESASKVEKDKDKLAQIYHNMGVILQSSKQYRFTPQEGVGRAIIVITDGENHEGGAVEAAQEAAEKGMQVFVLGVGSPDGSPIPAEDGSNNFRRDKDGNVIVTRLNEQMCQEIAKAGNGMYIRVDNTNSAEKVLNNEIAKLSKADVESQVYTEFDEQFQALAWLVLILLVVEMLILERKNPLFKNVRLFK